MGAGEEDDKMKILSIDPGLRNTGFAVLEKKENRGKNTHILDTKL